MLDAPTLLSGWQDFYVIIGSSAAALTGLNFVVVALSAEARAAAPPAAALSAFATPTVVHFGAVLLVAAIVTAPWPSHRNAAWALGFAGVAGLVYALNIVRHTRRQTVYQPVVEDWIFHIILPVASYGALAVGGFALARGPAWPMFVIGGAALMLTYIGIHNAWDSAMYLAVSNRQPEGGGGGGTQGSTPTPPAAV